MMEKSTLQEAFSATDIAIEQAVLNVLNYYALFRYPVSIEEIVGNAGITLCAAQVDEALFHLINSSQAFCYDDYYYSTIADIETVGRRRVNANKIAKNEIAKAAAVGRFLYKFPFVRFVGISGSLSKGYADEKSDYDFFIITSKDRLWICRTILHLFKKMTFLIGKEHNFCMNYFLDDSMLTLEEQNRFTAVEISTVVPVRGIGAYEAFLQANCWVKHFMPNVFMGFIAIENTEKQRDFYPLKKLAESILNMIMPWMLNKKLMCMTDKKWRAKWDKKNFPKEEYRLAFKTTLHISKNHYSNYQKKILEKLPAYFR